ncbi:MAG: polysaccharide deacetylase family protein, partial [Planctomycetota bacterium]
MALRHVLTIDLEDWFHVCGAERDLPVSTWDELPSQLPETTARILDLLDEHDTKATFFVLGYVARRFPETVAAAAARGHEIASHGYAHQRVYEMTPRQFADDLRRSVLAIEEACGVTPRSFRAPEWSIRPSCDWAFEVLAEQGFTYDSSIVPLTWLGSRSFPALPYDVETPAGTIREFPLSTERAFHERVPYSGGLPLRLHPEWSVFEFLRRSETCMVYTHPSDFEDAHPASRMPLNRKFVQRFRRDCVLPRFRRMLHCFEFVTLADHFQRPRQNRELPPVPDDVRRALRRSFLASAPWWYVAAPAAA